MRYHRIAITDPYIVRDNRGYPVPEVKNRRYARPASPPVPYVEIWYEDGFRLSFGIRCF